jgi:hypothetical protein
LNDYFGTNFKETLEDGLTVKNHSYEDLVEFLNKPKFSCRYCTENIYNNLHFPEITKFEKSEWIIEE